MNAKEIADRKHQDMLNARAVAKTYPDAYLEGNSWITSEVNTDNFKGMDFQVATATFSKIAVGCRLYATIKRPSRPLIKVFSHQLYVLTHEHVIKLLNGMAPKKMIAEIGGLLKIQENNRRPTPAIQKMQRDLSARDVAARS